jgi:isopentenyl diphosphate isomerase/L-lactate dehydrogenase-like FMN-dependent dehydrogenase
MGGPVSRRTFAGAALALPAGLALPGLVGARPAFAVPETADQALDIFQLKAAAQRRLDAGAWHFIVNGADDLKTVDANRAAFDDWQIRVRRLVDVSRVETRVELFGQPLHVPILLAPVGGQQVVHPEAELATMRGASARGHLMVASTVTTRAIEEIRAAGTAPLWFQLYPSPDRDLMRFLLRRAEGAGCQVVVVTVDSPTRGNREGERWFAREISAKGGRTGNFEGFGGPPRIGDPAATWELVPWLRENTGMRIVLKGIVTGEDAAIARRRGVDGLIVSNHGGRQEESGRGTLECLPEVVAAVRGRLPVLVDGGIRRGTDVFKALALGATAVCVGRPYLFGLGAFGEAGVARALSILDSELTRIMQFAGTTTLDAIGPRSLARRTG